MEKEGAKERILRTSRRLFLENGYSETGLNQIVQESGAVKASLYQHFSSKEELGRVVLRTYSEENLFLLESLMKRYPKPLDFLSAWYRVILREAKQAKLFGCGMANFRAQIASKETKLLSEIESIAKKTIDTLATYLEGAQDSGYLSGKHIPKDLARQIFFLYEGVMQGYRLLGDLKVLSELPNLGKQLLSE